MKRQSRANEYWMLAYCGAQVDTWEACAAQYAAAPNHGLTSWSYFELEDAPEHEDDLWGVDDVSWCLACGERLDDTAADPDTGRELETPEALGFTRALSR